MSRSKKPMESDESCADDDNQQEEEFEVEKILKVRVNPKTKKKEYLVKWENWPLESSTWEPENNLKNVRDIVEEFEAAQKLRGGSNNGDTGQVQQQRKNPSSSSTAANKKNPPAKKQSNRQSSSRFSDEEEADLGLFPSDRTDKKHSASVGYSVQNGQLKEDTQSVKQQKMQHQPTDVAANAQQASHETDMNLARKEVMLEEEQPEHVFERIQYRRVQDGSVQYCVKFQGMDQPQWVMEQDLFDFQEEIEQFNSMERREALTEEETVLGKGSSPVIREIANTEQSNRDTPKYSHDRQKEDEEIGKVKQKPVQGSNQSLGEADGNKKQREAEEEQKEVMRKKKKKRLFSNRKRIEDDCSDEEEEEENEIPLNNNKREASQKKKQSIEQKKRPKRPLIHGASLNNQGDFRTDNVDQISILGDAKNIFSSRILVQWKQRDSGETPQSTVYSTTYVRRHEPDVLIEHFMNSLGKMGQH